MSWAIDIVCFLNSDDDEMKRAWKHPTNYSLTPQHSTLSCVSFSPCFPLCHVDKHPVMGFISLHTSCKHFLLIHHHVNVLNICQKEETLIKYFLAYEKLLPSMYMWSSTLDRQRQKGLATNIIASIVIILTNATWNWSYKLSGEKAFVMSESLSFCAFFVAQISHMNHNDVLSSDKKMIFLVLNDEAIMSCRLKAAFPISKKWTASIMIYDFSVNEALIILPFSLSRLILHSLVLTYIHSTHAVCINSMTK